MVSMGVCRNPVCKDCEEDEYMETYNKETMCERQPYCDPNSNFVWPESTSTTKRHQCLCEKGFHCSGSSCITCVPHTECELGFGATTIGDQTHDTVCEKCPEGTFSDEKSWNGTCKKKTTCESGTESKDGSSKSDHICVPNNAHVGIIAVVCVLVGAAVVAGLIYKLKCKGKARHGPVKMPTETEAPDYYKDDLHKDEENGIPFITTPTDDRELLRMPSQETAHPSEPTEESEDVVFTANGDILSQDGKEHVISQPETQAITIN